MPGDRQPVFVVQKHRASRLHYDFRLELDGTLKSWAVPKGPSMNPADKRLAVMTEDHPLEYADFEGIIPAGDYGGGSVIVWDRGTFERVSENNDASAGSEDIVFRLNGRKLHGTFALIHSRLGGQDRNWLLIKARDEWARSDGSVLEERPESVVSGYTLADLEEKMRDNEAGEEEHS